MSSPKNFEEDACNQIVTTVSADGQAPLGARTSGCTKMTKVGSCVYIYSETCL